MEEIGRKKPLRKKERKEEKKHVVVRDFRPF